MKLFDVRSRKVASRRSLVRLSFALASAGALAATPALAVDSDGDGTPDSADAYPCDATADGVAYAPAEGTHGMLMFEDLWPSDGDLDFNDATIAYNYEFLLGDGFGKKKAVKKEATKLPPKPGQPIPSNVVAIHATFNVLSMGAMLSNGFALNLPVSRTSIESVTLNFEDGVAQTVTPEPGKLGETVIPIVADMGTLFAGGYVNTTTEKPSAKSKTINLLIRFSDVASIDLSAAPFDVFLYRSDDVGHQIHLPQYGGTATMDLSLFGQGSDGSTDARHFVNTSGLPFALDVPSAVLWPQEGKSIDTVYPDIAAFAASGGTEHTDYYQTNIHPGNLWTGGSDSSVPPVPAIIGPGFPTATNDCAPWNGTVEFGTSLTDVPWDDAIDADGNVLVVGYTYGDFAGEGSDGSERAFIQKFDPTGATIWAHQITIPDQYFSEGRRVATDGAGNVYVAGSVGLDTSSYTFVARYSPDGNQDWVRFLGDGSESASGVTVAGNSVYVAGTSGGSSWLGINDVYQAAFLAKLDLSGNTQFVKGFVGPGGTLYPNVQDLVADSDGNPVFVGQVYVQGESNYRATAWKTDPTGALIWTHVAPAVGASPFPGGFTPSYDQAGYLAAAADKHGATFAAGYEQAQAYTTTQTTYCYYQYDGSLYCYPSTYNFYYYYYRSDATKLDASGGVAWTHAFAESVTDQNHSVTSYGYTYGATVDSADNLLVSGYFYGALTNNTGQYFVSKEDGATGNEVWSRYGTNSGSSYSFGTGICVDSSDASYLVGVTYGSIDGQPSVGDYDGFLAKFASDGTKL